MGNDAYGNLGDAARESRSEVGDGRGPPGNLAATLTRVPSLHFTASSLTMIPSQLHEKLTVTLWAVTDGSTICKLTTSEGDAVGFANARNTMAVRTGKLMQVTRLDGEFKPVSQGQRRF